MERSPIDFKLRADNLEIWFERITAELRHIEASIDATKGWGIFQNHVYSQEDLLSLPGFTRVYAYIGQMDDLVSNWRDNSSISDDRYKCYHEGRIRVERITGEIRSRIMERKTTAWEGILHVFTQVAQFIMTHIPILPELILARIGYSRPLMATLTERFINVDRGEL